MAHLLSLVSNEKVERSNTCVNKLVSELAIGCYFIYDHNFMISCDDLITKLQ